MDENDAFEFAEKPPAAWPKVEFVALDALIAKGNWDGLLPPLSEEEYALLKADIRARGVMIPIELDTDGAILDGQSRVRACRDLGFRKVPVFTRSRLVGEKKIEHILTLHIGRRQLTKQQKKTVAAKLRNRGWPQEKIAYHLGICQQTISNWLHSTNFGEPIVITGKDGKSYKAKRAQSLKRKSAPQEKHRKYGSCLLRTLRKRASKMKERSFVRVLPFLRWLYTVWIRAKRRLIGKEKERTVFPAAEGKIDGWIQ